MKEQNGKQSVEDKQLISNPSFIKFMTIIKINSPHLFEESNRIMRKFSGKSNVIFRPWKLYLNKYVCIKSDEMWEMGTAPLALDIHGNGTSYLTLD